MGALLRTLLQLAIPMAALYALLRLTCIRVWTLPAADTVLSAAVAPTLAGGDVVVLWRRGSRALGDVVRCDDPDAPGRFVVGRLLGVASDVVELEGGSLTVNARRANYERACTPSTVVVRDPRSGVPVQLACEVEQFGHREYARLREPSGSTAALRRSEVPLGSVYLVSDNRHFHDDSRDFGPLPADGCKELVILRLWGAQGWFDAARRMTPIR